MVQEAHAAAAMVGVVAVLCGIVAFAAWRAVVRTGNRRIHFVVAAFVLLGVKSLLKALSLASGQTEGPAAELAFSLADLGVVALIAWPLVLRRA